VYYFAQKERDGRAFWYKCIKRTRRTMKGEPSQHVSTRSRSVCLSLSTWAVWVVFFSFFFCLAAYGALSSVAHVLLVRSFIVETCTKVVCRKRNANVADGNEGYVNVTENRKMVFHEPVFSFFALCQFILINLYWQLPFFAYNKCRGDYRQAVAISNRTERRIEWTSGNSAYS